MLRGSIKQSKQERKRTAEKAVIYLGLAGIVFYLLLTNDEFRRIGNYEKLIRLVSVAFLLWALYLLVRNFGEIWRSFVDSRYASGHAYAIYFALTLVPFLFNPLEPHSLAVKRFDRVIGQGIANNVDVSRRINNFTVWVILLAAVFFAALLIANYYLQCDKDGHSEESGFFNDFIVVAACESVFNISHFFYEEETSGFSYRFSHYIVLLIVIAGASYRFLQLNRTFSKEAFLKACFCIASIGVPVTITFNPLMGHGWGDGRPLLGAYAFMLVLLIVLGRRLPDTVIEAFDKLVNRYTLIVISLFPLITSLFFEFINILNQHGVFVSEPPKVYRITFLLIITVVLASMYADGHVGNGTTPEWKSAAYPCFVVGVTFLSVQIPLIKEYTRDLFESSNHSIPISDFLNYGNIPIVEHYSGHMMTHVWEGILYGVINSDYYGAIVSPYTDMVIPLLILLFYALISFVWNRDMAIAISLLIPFYPNWFYYGLGTLICLAIIGFIRKNSYKRAFLIWLSFAWCTLYRLDLGFAFGLATIACLLIYVIENRDKNALKELAVTLAGTGLFFAVLWALLCLVKSINPYLRLKEFLEISMSNQSWAFYGIGDPELTQFSWAYIFIPACVVICLGSLIVSNRIKEKIEQKYRLVLMLFGFSYLFNISRGLVRHSMVEENAMVVYWSAYLFFALYVAVLFNKRLLIPAFMMLIAVNAQFVSDVPYEGVAIADNAALKIDPVVDSWITRDQETGRTVWEQISHDKDIVNRVSLNKETEDHINKYKLVLEQLLDDEETYVDFINQTFVYSALGKQDPAYVSQSPLQLSGEYTQERFIEEIRGVPIVIMPAEEETVFVTSLDGITNAYRFYKVYEYICQNYEPLCKYGDDFSVWCLHERKKDMEKRLDRLKAQEKSKGTGSNVKSIDYGFDGPVEDTSAADSNTYVYYGSLHNHSIKLLPRIWAENDSAMAINNEVISGLKNNNGIYIMDPDAYMKNSKGNYLRITADCPDTDGTIDNGEYVEGTVVMGNYLNDRFVEKCRYTMLFTEGRHDYLIRCSTDYYWYIGEINAVRIDGVPLENVEMAILEGD